MYAVVHALMLHAVVQYTGNETEPYPLGLGWS